MSLPVVKLNKGIHVMHLFYRIDRVGWTELASTESAETLAKIEKLCVANSAASHPRLVTYANIGGKADIVVMITAAELGLLGQIHRDFETCFPAGTLESVFSYLSITELPDYVTTEEEMTATLIQEKLEPGT